MSCKHKWQLHTIFDNSSIEYIYKGMLLGYQPKLNEANKEFAEFVCIKCWKSKLVKIKR